MRARDPTDPFDFDTADLERLMAAMRGPDTASTTMRARLREFQKRSFPKFANAGRGKRSVYSLREALQIAMAFELVDLDLSSPRCINIVEQNRRALDHVFLAAWSAIRRTEDDLAAAAEAGARLTIHVALSAATHDRGSFVTFGPVERNGPPTAWPGRRSRMTIDAVTLVADFVTALEGETFRFLPREVDEAFRSMGAETYGDAEAAGWRLPTIAPHDDRVKL